MDFEAKHGEMPIPVRTFNREKLTPQRIATALCPNAKRDHMIWDSEADGLGLRIYSSGQKSWWFQFRVDGKPARMKIGDATGSSWPVGDARREARRLKVLVDQKVDPRDERQDKSKERVQRKAQEQMDALTLKELWGQYVSEHAERWSQSHLRDHHAVMREPGIFIPKTKKQTIAGPLWALASERVVDIPAKLEAWLKKETKTRPTLARKSFVLLKTCLSWHGIELVSALDGKQVRNLKKVIPKPKTKDDVLEASMLEAWWTEVSKLPMVSSIFLKCLLLVGCRRNELAELRWSDVDLKWGRMTLKDKIEGTRVIPLPTYVRHLILELKDWGARVDVEREDGRLRRAATTGSSPLAGQGDTELVFRALRGHGGPSNIEKHHGRATKAGGLPHITQHGLRRTFITLGEEAGVPSGAIAQVAGHRPSALVERSYKRRSIDKLAEYAQTIENFILRAAGVDPIHAPGERPKLKAM